MPEAVGDFVAWYGRTYPETRAILVNYVFLSRALLAAPGRPQAHRHARPLRRPAAPVPPLPGRAELLLHRPTGEAAGLARADVALAIQSEEAAYFSELTDRRVHLLPPRFPAHRPFAAPARLARIGFIGHGNDPNRSRSRASPRLGRGLDA